MFGIFCLQFELFDLQFEFFAYSSNSLSFFADNRKVRLISTLMECKQGNSTVSGKTPTVSKIKSAPNVKDTFVVTLEYSRFRIADSVPLTEGLQTVVRVWSGEQIPVPH